MITVSFKSRPTQENDLFSDPSAHFIAGIVNWKLATCPNVWRPPTDMFETENNLVVRVDIAGMDEEDFSINIEQGTLTICGNRPEIAGRKAYHQLEIPFGEFSTEVKFSIPIDLGKVTAEYHNGFLVVTLPKKQPKQINITTKNEHNL